MMGQISSTIEGKEPIERSYLFSWDEIPGNDSERFIEFLIEKFGIDWVKIARIEKIDDNKTIRVSTEKKSLSLRLNDGKTKVNLQIDDGRADEFVVKTKNGKLNVYERSNRSIAIVSGKGGSGKTMVAAVMTRVLDHIGLPALIVDSDTVTAGMTYYLGLKLVPNIAVGLADVAVKGVESGFLPLGAVQPLKGYNDAKFVGIGDHRRLNREVDEDKVPILLEQVLNQLRSSGRWIVVDCRGGIDQDSIAVCKAVDDILLVIETDTTSFQATRYLVDILTEKELAYKIRGFVINKVFSDPSTIILRASELKVQYFSSIPFDFRAMRAFLVGDVPSIRSLFGIHIWEALHKAYPDSVPPPEGRPWTLKEFREVSLTNPDSLWGGIVISGIIFMLGINLIAVALFSPSGLSVTLYRTTIFLFFLLGLIGSMETTRRFVGRALDEYLRFMKSLFKEGEY
jgi:flagellar biosynthesis protein FlhG